MNETAYCLIAGLCLLAVVLGYLWLRAVKRCLRLDKLLRWENLQWLRCACELEKKAAEVEQLRALLDSDVHAADWWKKGPDSEE